MRDVCILAALAETYSWMEWNKLEGAVEVSVTARQTDDGASSYDHRPSSSSDVRTHSRDPVISCQSDVAEVLENRREGFDLLH